MAYTGTLKVKVLEASDLKAPRTVQLRSLNPYVQLQTHGDALGKTAADTKTESPVWNEQFVCHVEDTSGTALGLPRLRRRC